MFVGLFVRSVHKKSVQAIFKLLKKPVIVRGGSVKKILVEETLKIEEYSSPWYYIDSLSSNLWKKNKFLQKESSFFVKNSITALEKNTLRGEHILLTDFTNTRHSPKHPGQPP